MKNPAEGIRLGGKGLQFLNVFLWRISVIGGNLANIHSVLCVRIMFHRRVGVKVQVQVEKRERVL